MKKKRILLFLLFFFGCGILISLLLLFSWMRENQKTEEIVKEEAKHLKKEKVYYLEEELFEKNSDTIGWILVPGTSISYPVVRTNDNDYYLDHDFYREKNSAGWIFLDSHNTLSDQNLVIYGHHRHDGSMFGDIDLLFDSNYYQEHSEVLFITKEEEIHYQIFSVYKISSNDSYILPDFDDFEKNIQLFQKRSEISLEEKKIETSQILTLSTCHDNNRDRLVVHGYRKN